MSRGREGTAASRIRGLYAILDPSVLAWRSGGIEAAMDAALSETLAGGCRLVQYRDKAASPRLMLSRAARLARACERAGALFVVNDRLDIALLCGAGGCHLGQDDLPIRAARRIVPEGFLLGASTHDAAEAGGAEGDGADYVGAGAVFPTATKGDALCPRGPGLVTEVAAAVSIPVVAISGITRSNVREAIKAGASAFAVISDLFSSPGTRERTEEFLKIWEKEKSR